PGPERLRGGHGLPDPQVHELLVLEGPGDLDLRGPGAAPGEPVPDRAGVEPGAALAAAEPARAVLPGHRDRHDPGLRLATSGAGGLRSPEPALEVRNPLRVPSENSSGGRSPFPRAGRSRRAGARAPPARSAAAGPRDGRRSSAGRCSARAGGAGRGAWW